MPRLSVWMVRAALLHLGIGFSVGALLLFNKGAAFEATIWRVLQVHVEMLMFGWIIQLAMGVAFWILPRFARPPKHGRVWLAVVAFTLINLGVLCSAAGQWFGIRELELAGRVGILFAGLSFAIHIFPRVKPMEFVSGSG
ncbi:MAG: hypothetical protein IPK19_34610 [Chloroflexi bacterium]|nr:hypothetical protein [Chloroflexota bacterium]